MIIRYIKEMIGPLSKSMFTKMLFILYRRYLDCIKTTFKSLKWINLSFDYVVLLYLSVYSRFDNNEIELSNFREDKKV